MPQNLLQGGELPSTLEVPGRERVTEAVDVEHDATAPGPHRAVERARGVRREGDEATNTTADLLQSPTATVGSAGSFSSLPAR